MVQQGPFLPSLRFMLPGAGDNIWPVEKSHQEEEVSKALGAARCLCFEVITKDKHLYWKKQSIRTILHCFAHCHWQHLLITEVLYSRLVSQAKARSPLTKSRCHPSLPTLFLVPDLTVTSLFSLLPGECWPWPGRHGLLFPAVIHYLHTIIHYVFYAHRLQLVVFF